MLEVTEVRRDPCADITRPVKRPDISDRDKTYETPVPEPQPRLITPQPDDEPAPVPFNPGGIFPVPALIPTTAAAVMQCMALCDDFFREYALWRERNRDALNSFLSQAFHGRVTGDPHLVTLDGLSYDLQGAGEFDLVTAPSWDFDVQGRFKPLNGSVSTLSSLAFQLDDHTVEFNGTTLLVDHIPTTVPDGSYLYFDRGAALLKKNGQYLAVWPGQTLRPMMAFDSSLNPRFYLPPGTPTAGLLGNNNGSRTDEFALRDGTSLGASPSPQVLYGDYIDSWRITDASSDFTYGAGESTATYSDRTFPHNVVKLADFTGGQINDASAACTQLGILRGPQFDSCLYDMLVTGDINFAAVAAAPGDQVAVDAAGVDSSGKLVVGFEGTVPSNFRNTYLSSDAATTTYAGPIVDRSGYGFSVPDIPAHTSAQISFDLIAIGPWNGDAIDQTVALKIDGNQVWQTKFVDTGNASDPVVNGTGLGGPRLTGTLSSGVPFAVFPVTVTLDHQAAQLRADFTTSGLSSASLKFLGIDNIDIQMQLVPPQTFDVSLPVSVSDGVPAGGAGNLETAVSHDQYRFTVPAGGQSVFLADQGCPSYMKWTLKNTTTGATPASDYCYNGNKEIDNLPAGQYVLEWAGTNNASGPYSFQLMPVTIDAFDVTLPVSVSNGVPGTGAGNLETTGAHDQYRFTVPAGGQSVFLADQGCPSYMKWTLKNTTTGATPA
ncbi:VWD domain-containing protein, partial [Arthrobacter sp. M4]|uniref:VWD domain-containing protein n=1 Tax=Arthrobacter sp. M4 TaxID=218160 RepID=UPI001CDCC3D5